jgi:hypothetical protein
MKRDRSRRYELQRLLGDLGEILPRVECATPARPAKGWYARLSDGKIRFLGDNTRIAALAIAKLIGQDATQELVGA